VEDVNKILDRLAVSEEQIPKVRIIPDVIRAKDERGQEIHDISAYDLGRREILISSFLIDAVKRNPEYSKVLEHCLAHEFCHYLQQKYYPITDRNVLEYKAIKYAEQFSGLTYSQAAEKIAEIFTELGKTDLAEEWLRRASV
jgi:hypothetical protein